MAVTAAPTACLARLLPPHLLFCPLQFHLQATPCATARSRCELLTGFAHEALWLLWW